MNNVTGKRLDKALKTIKVSQKELADSIGVTPSAVSQYIKGKAIPSDEILLKICDTLKISPSWLKGYDDLVLPTPITTSSRQKLLNQYFEDMNREGQKKLVEYAEDIFDKYMNDFREYRKDV